MSARWRYCRRLRLRLYPKSAYAGHALPSPCTALALATGMRRGERFSIRVCVRVERSLEQTQKGLRVKQPKTRSWASAMSPSQRHAIAMLRNAAATGQRELRPVWPSKASTCSPMPCRVTGRVCAAAVNCLSCPSMRCEHTSVSLLLASGMDVLKVARRMGHGKPSITLKVLRAPNRRRRRGGRESAGGGARITGARRTG